MKEVVGHLGATVRQLMRWNPPKLVIRFACGTSGTSTDGGLLPGVLICALPQDRDRVTCEDCKRRMIEQEGKKRVHPNDRLG